MQAYTANCNTNLRLPLLELNEDICRRRGIAGIYKGWDHVAGEKAGRRSFARGNLVTLNDGRLNMPFLDACEVRINNLRILGSGRTRLCSSPINVGMRYGCKTPSKISTTQPGGNLRGSEGFRWNRPFLVG